MQFVAEEGFDVYTEDVLADAACISHRCCGGDM